MSTHNTWKEDKIMLAVRASIFGCLGVHADLSHEGVYVISHTSTGYAVPTHGLPFPEDKVSCQNMAEALVKEIPNLDEFFTLVVDGNATKKMNEEIVPKIFAIAERYAPPTEALT